MNIDDPTREPLEKRSREQMHVTGQHDEVDPAQLEPVGELAIARGAIRVAARVEDAVRDSGGVGACEPAGVGAIRRDGCDRQSGVDQGLQIRSLAGDEHADHASSPMTIASGGASGTTAHMPMPTLKTRRSSSSSIPCSVSHLKTRG